MLSHACQRALCSGFVPQIEHRDLGHTQAMGEKEHTKMNPWRDVSTETFLLQISVPLAMTVQMDPGQLLGRSVFCRAATVSTQLFEAEHSVITQSLLNLWSPGFLFLVLLC